MSNTVGLSLFTFAYLIGAGAFLSYQGPMDTYWEFYTLIFVIAAALGFLSNGKKLVVRVYFCLAILVELFTSSLLVADAWGVYAGSPMMKGPLFFQMAPMMNGFLMIPLIIVCGIYSTSPIFKTQQK